jgi:hypothetical protein
MRLAGELSLRSLAAASDTAPPRSEILLDGASTGIEIEAAVLEAAVALPGRFLLFTTDDLPFEEMLGIHLFDAELELLDRASIGGAYVTGSFSSLELHPPDSLSFRFIGDVAWQLTVLPRPVLRSPFHPEPAGVRRGLRPMRHFIIGGLGR